MTKIIRIVEPEDGFQEIIDGKVVILCDCAYTDKCPQGKKKELKLVLSSKR